MLVDEETKILVRRLLGLDVHPEMRCPFVSAEGRQCQKTADPKGIHAADCKYNHNYRHDATRDACVLYCQNNNIVVKKEAHVRQNLNEEARALERSTRNNRRGDRPGDMVFSVFHGGRVVNGYVDFSVVDEQQPSNSFYVGATAGLARVTQAEQFKIAKYVHLDLWPPLFLLLPQRRERGETKPWKRSSSWRIM